MRKSLEMMMCSSSVGMIRLGEIFKPKLRLKFNKTLNSNMQNFLSQRKSLEIIQQAQLLESVNTQWLNMMKIKENIDLKC